MNRKYQFKEIEYVCVFMYSLVYWVYIILIRFGYLCGLVWIWGGGEASIEGKENSQGIVVIQGGEDKGLS